MINNPAAGARAPRYLKALSSGYLLLIVNVVTYAVSVPLFLEWLGSQKYGVWLVYLQLAYMLSLVTSWIAAPVVREAAACYVEGSRDRCEALYQTGFLYYFTWGVVIVALGFAAGPFIPNWIGVPHEVQTDAHIGVISVSIYIAGLMQFNLLIALLNGLQRMHVANLLLAGLTLLAVGSGLLAARYGFGISGLAFGQLVALLVVSGLAAVAVRSTQSVRVGVARFDRALLRRLLRSGGDYFWYSMSYLVLQSDVALVGFMLGPAAAAVYGVSYKLVDYAVQLIWKIPDSLLPIIAELEAGRHQDRLLYAHRMSSKIAIALALLAAILVGAFGHPTLVAWIGAEHAAPPELFLAFALVLFLQVVVHCSLVIPYGTNRMTSLSAMAMLEAVLKIVATLLLIPRIGILGAALGSVVAQVTVTGWYAPMRACRITGDGLRGYLSAVMRPAVPAALAGIATVLIVGFSVQDPWLRVVIGVPSTVISFAILYFHHGLDFQERRLMFGGLQRMLRA